MRYLLMILVLAACAGTPSGKAFEDSKIPRSKDATIVIYRPARAYSDSGLAHINANGFECKLRNAGWFYLNDMKGNISLNATGWGEVGTSRMILQAEPGKTYFAKLVAKEERMTAAIFAGYAGILIDEAVSDVGGPFRWFLVEESQARKELRAFKQDENCQDIYR